MGKLRCLCGNQLSDVLCPNNLTGLLLRDLDMEAADGADAMKLMNLGRGVWECHECGRIAFDWPDSSSGRVKFYRPEDGTPGHLCDFTATERTPATQSPTSRVHFSTGAGE